MAYTTIDDPSAYFHTQLYTGDGSSSNAITNNANAGNFQPDWLWTKCRSESRDHQMIDSSRGDNLGLRPNSNIAEYGASTEIDSNGFTMTDSSNTINGDGRTYVAWQWKANGGTTTTNDASATSVGTIDSVYQANTTAGFSIVTYTGTTSAGTIAHGLGAVPRMIIIKNRDDGAENWAVYHAGIASDAETDYLYLDSTNAAADDANLFNDTAPTSTVFSIGTSGVVNQAEAHVAYCFSEVKGYSKIGTYEGNGNADGTFVYTGFQPEFIMIKNIDATFNWMLFDNTRDEAVINSLLEANTPDAERVDDKIDFVSNGFKLRSTSGENNGSYTFIYMAFAKHPFVSSKGVPTTAR